jgi:endonuclease/exonuclease/phosphatase family metal-dependent hydrolase
MNDALDSILTYYHPLCDINLDNVDPQSKERICPRSAIKILTYNIFLRPPPIKTNENDWKDERMYEFIKHFPQFDIICLQEMFGTFNSRKHDLIRFAVKSGFFFFVDTPSPSFLSKYLVDGGLVILSRFPIIESAFIPFKYGVLSDSLAQKGVLYAKIEIKNTILHLFTTHLQASYFGSTEYHWVKVDLFRMFPTQPESTK